MERFFRTTKPVGTEVPRGAPPGGTWKRIYETVVGSVRNHKRPVGYVYTFPDGNEGPEPFAGVTGLYKRREDIPIVSIADADARLEKEKEAKETEIG